MNRDEFFDNIFNEATPAADDIKRLRQLAYEERVIKRAIIECGVRVSGWGRLCNRCYASTDIKKLNFDWFNSEYGGLFPGRLLGCRIPYLHNITLPELFKPGKQNRLIKRLARELRAAEIDPLTARYMFVFPLIRTPFCAHTFTLEPPGLEQNLQVLFNLAGAKRPIIVEPLKNACAAIGADWFTV